MSTTLADLSATKADDVSYAVSEVAVVWNSKTTSGRTINVYGSNTAYTAPSELYSEDTQGTLVGTLVYDGETTTNELEFTDEYLYLGICSASGSLYLDSFNVNFTEATGESSDGEEDEDTTTGGDGTADNPYTVAEALEIINADGFSQSDSQVYITGTISSIDEISTSYGNATYYLSDDGSTAGDQLMVFRGYSLDGAKFTSSSEIAVGDVLVVYGYLYLYGSIAEVKTGSSIISINGGEGTLGSSDDDSEGYTFTKVTSITSGNYYVLVSDSYASTCISESYSYGYLPTTTDFTLSDDASTITISSLDDALTFTASDSGYYITDCFSRYYYTSSSYNSFNVSTSLPSSGAEWTVSFNSDDTATITNVSTEKYIQIGSGYTTFGNYSSSQGTTLPTLYEYAATSSDSGDTTDDDTGSGDTDSDDTDGGESGDSDDSSTTTTTDAITISSISFSGTSGYSDWTQTGSSGTTYAGKSNYTTLYIQFRSSGNEAGLVNTSSIGTISKVSVSWNSGTTSGRTLNVYGSNTAYTAPSDLYSSDTQGTLLGTIVYDGSTSAGYLDISGSYQYVGMCSSSSAMYLDEIDLTWATDSAE